MRLLVASVVFLVSGAGCLALAIVLLIGTHHRTHWRRVVFLAGSGIALVITGGRLLVQALAQKKLVPMDALKP
jgi:uncharacterized membrane protein